MPARIHQDYGRYLLRRGDLRETRREKERARERRGEEEEDEKGEEEERRRSFVSVFVYHESGRAFFESRGVALWRSFARGKWHRNEIECYRLVNRQD